MRVCVMPNLHQLKQHNYILCPTGLAAGLGMGTLAESLRRGLGASNGK